MRRCFASLFTDRGISYRVDNGFDHFKVFQSVGVMKMVRVGGIKEKALAAQRAGLHTVLLPARNLKDLRELPASARAAMQFIALDIVDDTTQGALAVPGTLDVPPDFKLV